METYLSRVISEDWTHWAKQRHAALPCPSLPLPPMARHPSRLSFLPRQGKTGQLGSWTVVAAVAICFS